MTDALTVRKTLGNKRKFPGDVWIPQTCRTDPIYTTLLVGTFNRYTKWCERLLFLAGQSLLETNNGLCDAKCVLRNSVCSIRTRNAYDFDASQQYIMGVPIRYVG